MSDSKNSSAGRKKKFTKEWLDRKSELIPDIMREGNSLAHVAVELGMSIETLNKCKNDSELFSEAIKEGLALSEQWWTDLGKDLATGATTGNATVWIFNMKNRFKWRDTNKDYVKADLVDCKDNLERMTRVIEQTAKGELSIQDAALYRNLLRSFADEEITHTIGRVKKLEDVALGSHSKPQA